MTTPEEASTWADNDIGTNFSFSRSWRPGRGKYEVLPFIVTKLAELAMTKALVSL